jgi:hypothetical protein
MASPDRSRSQSPKRSRSPEKRRRSRSPERRRSPPRKPRGGGGFKWKDKSRDNRRDEGRDGRDGRGNDSYRPRRYHEERFGRDRDERMTSGRDLRDRDVPSKNDESSKTRRHDRDGQTKSDKPTKPITTAAKPSAPATFITVFVNDRLGTKAQIPCLPSDTIGKSRLCLLLQGLN